MQKSPQELILEMLVLGIAQQDIVNGTGISKSFISHLKKGGSMRPSYQIMNKLVEFHSKEVGRISRIRKKSNLKKGEEE